MKHSSKHTSRSVSQVLSIALLLTGSLVLTTGIHAQTGKPDDKKAAPKAALSVSAVSPSVGALGMQLQANGNVAAWQEASIGAEVNGLKITDVRVNVGDIVKKGQILATFSADGAKADILQAQASLA